MLSGHKLDTQAERAGGRVPQAPNYQPGRNSYKNSVLERCSLPMVSGTLYELHPNQADSDDGSERMGFPTARGTEWAIGCGRGTPATWMG